MKTMLALCAATMVLTNSVGSAYAADGDSDGQSTLFTSVEAQQQQHSLAVGALHSPPLFTRGGVGVRVWTPMEQAYNAIVNEDLAAKDIWGPG